MIYFEQQIDPATFKKVQKVEKYIKEQQHKAIIDTAKFKKVKKVEKYIKEQQHKSIIEIMPSYCSIMLHIDITKQKLIDIVNQLNLEQLNQIDLDDQPKNIKTISLPVLYDGEY